MMNYGEPCEEHTREKKEEKRDGIFLI